MGPSWVIFRTLKTQLKLAKEKWNRLGHQNQAEERTGVGQALEPPGCKSMRPGLQALVTVLWGRLPQPRSTPRHGGHGCEASPSHFTDEQTEAPQGSVSEATELLVTKSPPQTGSPCQHHTSEVGGKGSPRKGGLFLNSGNHTQMLHLTEDPRFALSPPAHLPARLLYLYHQRICFSPVKLINW